jgi:mono/diheme cytochrome c family protein
MTGKLLVAVVLVLSFMGNVNAFDSLRSYRNGKSAFQTRCASCHGVHREIAGPMLASIVKKRPSAWLLQFIRNSQDVVAAGDPYANQLYEKFNHQVMPAFAELPDSDIQDILNYIAHESRVPVEQATLEKDVQQRGNAPLLHGLQLFQEQCSTCHSVTYETGYAPCLGSVVKRRPAEWLIPFIRNSQQVIHSGDPYANYLFDRYDRREMPSMTFLTGQDLNDILTYIEFVSASDPAEAGANGRKKITPSVYALVNSGETHSGPTLLPVKVLLTILVITGVSVYAYVIVRLFRYVKEELPD